MCRAGRCCTRGRWMASRAGSAPATTPRCGRSTVAEAQWTTPDRLQPPVKGGSAVAALRFDLACLADVSFDKLELRSLRFLSERREQRGARALRAAAEQLRADPGARPGATRGCGRSSCRPARSRAIGFGEDEAMLPYTRRSFAGYRLLQEYFAFPEKFFFIELTGLEALAAAGFRERARVRRADLALRARGPAADARAGRFGAKTLRPGSTPIINLFEHTAEPILLDQLRHEYPVVPDVRRRHALEIFSIEEVVSANPQTRKWRASSRSSPTGTGARGRRNRPSGTRRGAPRAKRHDDGTDIFLSLVDLSGQPAKVERGDADRALPVHQPRSAGAAAVWQRGGRLRAGGHALDPPHRDAEEAHADACARRWARRRCGG